MFVFFTYEEEKSLIFLLYFQYNLSVALSVFMGELTYSKLESAECIVASESSDSELVPVSRSS